MATRTTRIDSTHICLCGCEVQVHVDGYWFTPAITFCKLHREAEALAAHLKAVLDLVNPVDLRPAHTEARALLARIGG